MNTDFLQNFKFSMYGESHGTSIGAIIQNVPSNFELDINEINNLLEKRNPNTFFNTKRKDKTEVVFESGLKDNKTTGTPLMFRLINDDINSKDYNNKVFRLNHGDYVGYKKFGENYPYAGGGPFSGRITAVIVVIGEVARQILKKENYDFNIYSQIKNIGHLQFDSLLSLNNDYIKENLDTQLFVCTEDNKIKLIKYLEKVKQNNDGVGAKLEFKVVGLKEHLGDLYFNSFESILAHALFSIPGIKGVNFGVEEDYYKLLSSELNLDFEIDKTNNIKVSKNINGGINGGITNVYEDIYFNCIIKPPVSIAQEIELLKLENEKYSKVKQSIKGRHDTFIGNKAIYVVEAWINIIILDMVLQNKKQIKY